VKRSAGVLLLAVALAACSGGEGREFARYYDPRGLFSTHLPAGNVLTVTPPQPAAEGPGLLTGVISSPPQPSPSPAVGGFGGGAFGGVTEMPDQTTYQAVAITTDGFTDLGEMGLYFLTGDPSIDLSIDDRVRLDGNPARLLVADVLQGEQPTASIAAAFTLGEGGTGFVIAAVFPPGGWEDERDDFYRVLESFRGGIPPGMDALPIVAPEA
jgi:hypothetical protein